MQPSKPAVALPPIRASRRTHSLCVALIVLLWLVLYLPGLWSPPLLDDADSVHAEAAREMMLRGDWSTLYVNGLRYLEKAPLLYWGMAASYKIFGPLDWAARLPLAIAVLALLLATFHIGRHHFDAERQRPEGHPSPRTRQAPTAGLYAAMALGLSFGPYIYTRILLPDILVALWLTLGLHCFLLTLEPAAGAASVAAYPSPSHGRVTLDAPRPSRPACWGLAASTALNVLTKGLIGAVFPVAVIVAYLALTRNLRHLLRMRLASSFAIFLAIAAPWHIVAGLRNPPAGDSPGFFWFYFVNEHFLRYLNQRFPRDYDTVPLLLFWALALLFLLPWSAFAFHALAAVPRRWRELPSLDRRGRALLLFATTVLVVIGFFSFSSRQEYYVLPALPPLALILGAWFSQEQFSQEQFSQEQFSQEQFSQEQLSQEQGSPAASPTRRAGQRVALVSFLVAVPLALSTWGLLWFSQRVPPQSQLADLLTRNPSEYALSFGHIFDLTPRAMGMFRPELFLIGAAFFGGTLASWQLRLRNRPAAANAALAVMMLISLQCVHSALVTFSPILSSRALSDALVRVYRPGDVIVVNGAYEDASTLNFYGHLPLHVLNSRENGNLYFGSLFPDSPAIFEDDASLAKLWRGPARVFVFTQQNQLPPLLQQTGYRTVARSGGKLILANRP
jgi:4-amino-4-deoxy-L-arabinose transferase-like glycosyltransferase